MQNRPSDPIPTSTEESFGRDVLSAIANRRSAIGSSAAVEMRIKHVREIPARSAAETLWPAWVDSKLVGLLNDSGVAQPWSHQAEAASHAFAGRDVVLATGTASGKSLAYQLPIVTELLTDDLATALYLAPTKALGNDQLRTAISLADGLAITTAGPAAYDGDTSTEAREWARKHSRWVFTNPDMVHTAMLRSHGRWSRFLRHLRYVVVDESHSYRGIFGSHVSLVLRRLQRIARRYGAEPVFILTSATTAEPADSASKLTGRPCRAVTADGSPHGPRTVALWEPPIEPGLTGEHGAQVRRSAATEAAELLADLVAEGARTLLFMRSRRGAEYAAIAAAQNLAATTPELASRIRAYRAGHLAEDRRAIESALSSGELVGVASTNALELGIDIAGLDAIVQAGYPGTRAAFWQQIGRAGRRGQGSLAVLIARDDPLDAYLIASPAALLDEPVESTVIDPTNPHVLAPHLLCAARELPLTANDISAFDADEVTEFLIASGELRRRVDTWFPTSAVDPHDEVDLRGGSGAEVAIIEAETGRLIGTVGADRAPATVHDGAVYLHQGESYVVESLDLVDGIALVTAADPGWSTSAREVSDISVAAIVSRRSYLGGSVGLVDVDVSSRVVGYIRRLRTGEVLDYTELEMPHRQLHTRATMWTFDPTLLSEHGIDPKRVPGSLHAAEHAAIGLLPLVAMCDRGDIGGVSTACHQDTAMPTIFVYDGADGGAGFAERGDRELLRWLTATRSVIDACRCQDGCPACVQSPKCGNGNSPLDKSGASVVLGIAITALTSMGQPSMGQP